MKSKEEIIGLLTKALGKLGVADAIVKLEYPEDPEHGDFSSNVALIYAKKLGMKPLELAGKIVDELKKSVKDPQGSVAFIGMAGPGFINFKVKDETFVREIVSISNESSVMELGISNGSAKSNLAEQKAASSILIEYTDPNIFKAFHIGHLMSNAIGESISRLIEFSGEKVIRICYPSDIGLHIAKSIWAMDQHVSEIPSEAAPIVKKTAFLGNMYVEGTNAYDEDPTAKNEIDELNQAIYDKSDEAVNSLYEKGRQWSLEHFDELYDLLGTHFDEQIFESEMAPVGLEIVRSNVGKIFEESDGAIVFKGERYGLHTRVFVNSRGLPTYETKDIGLNATKFKMHEDASKSIIVTANEQNDYFKVIIKVISLLNEPQGKKTAHIGHGMLRFASGKMSSRTGNVITADELIGEMKTMVVEKVAHRGFTPNEVEEVSDIVAIGAIKYTILRQSIGSDVIFDSASSISFEGDSGPYLQYSTVRARSILEKAGSIDLKNMKLSEKVGLLERILVRFPDMVERAKEECAPQIIANYLVQLAGAFNSYYANQTIIDEKDALSAYRVSLTKAFESTMTRGLWLLGIKVPKRM